MTPTPEQERHARESARFDAVYRRTAARHAREARRAAAIRDAASRAAARRYEKVEALLDAWKDFQERPERVTFVRYSAFVARLLLLAPKIGADDPYKVCVHLLLLHAQATSPRATRLVNPLMSRAIRAQLRSYPG